MASLDGSQAGDAYHSGRRTLAIGAGGSGVLTVTHLKALYLSRFGRVRPGTKFLGFDVLELPPVVAAPARPAGDTEARAVRLEPGLEYCQVGRDCEPTRLGALYRNNPDLNPRLQKLLEQQPDGRFTKSLQSGSQGERLYGLLALLWSLPEVRRLLLSTLRALNDLRLPGEERTPGAASIATQVTIAGSVVGGVGSAIALPLCREVKRAMDLLGMDVHQSTFIAVCFTPDCFPETALRLANAYDTLNDFAIAQKKGVVP